MLAQKLFSAVWICPNAPDDSVHDFNGDPYIGEYAVNFQDGALYQCKQNGIGSQIWMQNPNFTQVSDLIAAIPQANWTQSLSSSSDYIKNKPSIPAAQVQCDWSQISSGSIDYIKNKPSIPSAQIQSDWTQASVGSLDYIKNKPAARSQSTASRALNSAFQVSTARWATVRYSVDISTTVSLSGSQIGSVILEMATNAAFTTGVQTLQSFSNGNSGTLVIGLILTQLNTACLSGDIPPGNYVRLRTVNITGVPTFTYHRIY